MTGTHCIIKIKPEIGYENKNRSNSYNNKITYSKSAYLIQPPVKTIKRNFHIYYYYILSFFLLLLMCAFYFDLDKCVYNYYGDNLGDIYPLNTNNISREGSQQLVYNSTDTNNSEHPSTPDILYETTTTSNNENSQSSEYDNRHIFSSTNISQDEVDSGDHIVDQEDSGNKLELGSDPSDLRTNSTKFSHQYNLTNTHIQILYNLLLKSYTSKNKEVPLILDSKEAYDIVSSPKSQPKTSNLYDDQNDSTEPNHSMDQNVYNNHNFFVEEQNSSDPIKTEPLPLLVDPVDDYEFISSSRNQPEMSSIYDDQYNLEENDSTDPDNSNDQIIYDRNLFIDEENSGDSSTTEPIPLLIDSMKDYGIIPSSENQPDMFNIYDDRYDFEENYSTDLDNSNDKDVYDRMIVNDLSIGHQQNHFDQPKIYISYNDQYDNQENDSTDRDNSNDQVIYDNKNVYVEENSRDPSTTELVHVVDSNEDYEMVSSSQNQPETSCLYDDDQNEFEENYFTDPGNSNDQDVYNNQNVFVDEEYSRDPTSTEPDFLVDSSEDYEIKSSQQNQHETSSLYDDDQNDFEENYLADPNNSNVYNNQNFFVDEDYSRDPSTSEPVPLIDSNEDHEIVSSSRNQPEISNIYDDEYDLQENDSFDSYNSNDQDFYNNQNVFVNEKYSRDPSTTEPVPLIDSNEDYEIVSSSRNKPEISNIYDDQYDLQENDSFDSYNSNDQDFYNNQNVFVEEENSRISTTTEPVLLVDSTEEYEMSSSQNQPKTFNVYDDQYDYVDTLINNNNSEINSFDVNGSSDLGNSDYHNIYNNQNIVVGEEDSGVFQQFYQENGSSDKLDTASSAVYSDEEGLDNHMESFDESQVSITKSDAKHETIDDSVDLEDYKKLDINSFEKDTDNIHISTAESESHVQKKPDNENHDIKNNFAEETEPVNYGNIEHVAVSVNYNDLNESDYINNGDIDYEMYPEDTLENDYSKDLGNHDDPIDMVDQKEYDNQNYTVREENSGKKFNLDGKIYSDIPTNMDDEYPDYSADRVDFNRLLQIFHMINQDTVIQDNSYYMGHTPL